MQRGGVAALCVPAVDVLRGAELLHASQAALLGGVQQGGVPPQQVLDVRVPVLHHVQGHVSVTILLGGIRSMLVGVGG